uniref:Uncharacterized protein n=1 Tax=Kalanchoe fedtschenkoi TaxID=63787 RepID=A0A7N0RHV6_KALFE
MLRGDLVICILRFRTSTVCRFYASGCRLRLPHSQRFSVAFAVRYVKPVAVIQEPLHPCLTNLF